MAYLILLVIGIVSARTVSPEDKDNGKGELYRFL